MSLQTVRKERGDLEREKRFLAAHAAGHDRIYRYFRRRTDNAATAEDLCAEVFRIAWEKTGEECALSVMVLFGIAKNVLRNHGRSAIRSASLFGALQLERYEESNPDQLRAMLNEAGLAVDIVFGGYHDEPVGHGVGTLTFTAHRP
ncbi:RNA polymerase sigma factor [Arthrobacter sp. NPDC056886]|uniref:RNA polymerase sigma factor n=1 Tax=Arthrobacter sp. NPDC056886 TaxID=3345960 RepID=UPI0036715525